MFCPDGFRWLVRNSLRIRRGWRNYASAEDGEGKVSFASVLMREIGADAETISTIEEAIRVIHWPGFDLMWDYGTGDWDLPELRYDRRIMHPELFALYLEGMLDADDFPRDEVTTALWEQPEEELAEILLQELRSADNSKLLTGMHGAQRLLSRERSEVMARSLLEALVKTGDEDHGVLVGSLPIMILFSCLLSVGMYCTRDLLLEFIPRMGINGLLAMGHLLLEVEDIIGRVGSHEPGTRMPAPEGWEQVDAAYVHSMSRKAAGLNIFAYKGAVIPMRIWIALDELTANAYLDDLFLSTDGVIECAISHLRTKGEGERDVFWHYSWGSSVSPQPARIIEVIEGLVNDGKLDQYEDERQREIGALYLLMKAKQSEGADDPIVNIECVHGRLGRWSAGIA